MGAVVTPFVIKEPVPYPFDSLPLADDLYPQGFFVIQGDVMWGMQHRGRKQGICGGCSRETKAAAPGFPRTPVRKAHRSRQPGAGLTLPREGTRPLKALAAAGRGSPRLLPRGPRLAAGGCCRKRGGRAAPPEHCGGGSASPAAAAHGLAESGGTCAGRGGRAGAGRGGAGRLRGEPGGGAALRLGLALGLRGLWAAAAAAAAASSLPLLPFRFFLFLLLSPPPLFPPNPSTPLLLLRRALSPSAVAVATAGASSFCAQIKIKHLK
ncbi:uncharacterized protein LOC144582943 [Callithrix jacchus]